MNQLGFIFDTNKCTGCNACQIACILENQLDFSMQWRQVVSFNEAHHPDVPAFHLSMACNHCADPPCMNYCPALAYSKDEKFGSVQIDPDKCIGCKYCSWVCPYDAPRFQPDTGIMAKCTLCPTRLADDLKPACVSVCPTDALQLGRFEPTHSQEKVPGFTPSTIGPSIKILPLSAGRELPEADNFPYDQSLLEKMNTAMLKPEAKTNLKSEWTLLLFTLLVPLLVALYAHFKIYDSSLNPIFLIGAAISGILISSIHLGKKIRAYRAILNWRKSWLSREILSYSLFLMLIILDTYVWPDKTVAGIVAIIAGMITLISIDMVYAILPHVKKQNLHSAQVTLTCMLYFSLLTTNSFLFVFIIVIKFWLYLRSRNISQPVLSPIRLIRIICGFILPVLLWASGYSLHGHLIWSSILVAEILDRIYFYIELDIITPSRQMQLDYEKWPLGSSAAIVSKTE